MRRSSDGKLPKVGGLFAEPSRKNLARPKGDIWVYPTESPEKGAFRLPETVNRAPLKIVKKIKKSKAQQAVHSDAIVPSSDLPGVAADCQALREQPDDARDSREHVNGEQEQRSVEGSPLPSSPPRFAARSDIAVGEDARGLHPHGPHGVQVEDCFPDGTARCQAVLYKNSQPEGPRHQQCRKPGTFDHEDGGGLRCKRHADKDGYVRCHYVHDPTGNATQCLNAGVNGTKMCVTHKNNFQEPALSKEQVAVQDQNGVEKSAPARDGSGSSAKRKSPDEDDNHEKPKKSMRRQKRVASEEGLPKHAGTRTRQNMSKPRSSPEVRIPVRKSSKIGSRAKTVHDDPPEIVTDTIEIEVPTQSSSSKRTRSGTLNVTGRIHRSDQGASSRPKVSARRPKATRTTRGKDDAADASHSDHSENEDKQNGTSEDEDVQHTQSRPYKHPSGTIEHVFEFLDMEERDGDCQTEFGASVIRICDEVSSQLQDSDITLENVADDIEELREVLKKAANVKKKRYRAVKEDLYGYVFRSIILVLQSLYDCLKEPDAETISSLDAMRIIVPFMRDILALKQTVASWKAIVPQRYQSDKIIRDVDMYLITPLRETEKSFRKRLSQLENRESTRRQAEEIKREAQRLEEELERQSELETARRDRWKRWQLLHITRIECEPDPNQRKRLRITKLEDLIETDANGEHFERVNLFKDRSAPSMRWATYLAPDTDWSDEQTTALLEGLEKYAGKSSRVRTQSRRALLNT